MKKKLVLVNTIVSLLYQLIVIICGFVLPQYILRAFGSETNGLVNSINQFLSIVSFLELGVGAVVSSALYGPLAKKDWREVSKVVSSANHFFGNIAKILLIYVVLLVIVFPFINSSEFDAFYTGSLIVIISVNSFAQYYIGIVDNIVLNANQQAYIVYTSQAIASIVNTVFCVILMKYGAGIHTVKAATAAVYIARPIIVRLYVNRKYNINRHERCVNDSINQKWNAVAQHISECVLDSTDIVVLTLFSSLSNVSVYYVYNLVVYNLKNFFLIASSSGILSYMGQMYSIGNMERVSKFFDKIEWMIHEGVVLIFSITAVLIVPFVKVYTSGISDAEYIQPLFALFIVIAHASHCIRLPYFLLVKSSGKYKETQSYFIYSTILNIVLSIVLVNIMGLPGCAIGTLVAMFLQTVCLARYTYKCLLKKDIMFFYRRIIYDVVQFGVIVIVGRMFALNKISYVSWIIMALEVGVFASICVVIFNYIFEREHFIYMLDKILKRR